MRTAVRRKPGRNVSVSPSQSEEHTSPSVSPEREVGKEGKKAGQGGRKAKSRSRSPSPLTRVTLPDLPVHACKEELMAAVEKNQILVVTGDTGCGKSTQLAQFLHEAGYTKRGIIATTQPRRIGAISLAKRVAFEMEVKVGQEVGYQIRFEEVCSDKTIIKYMTDGCLLRECLVHKTLQPYSVIVLDEAHERSLQTDILFGVLNEVIKARSDLKVIVTSATLDLDKFKSFFNCEAFHIPGRCFPVLIAHSEKTEKYYVDAAIRKAVEIHTRDPPGHILIFLTGQSQIEKACQVLGDKLDKLFDDGLDMPDVVILPLYAALPTEQQQMVFAPTAPGTRKIIFTTNICETSITVDGVVYVIDPGYVKQRHFNSQTGIDSLTVVPISKVAAVQRAGRAGRTQEGQCHRLYTEKVFKENLPDETLPEIQRTNLANTVLLLKTLGITNPLAFQFIDNPAEEALIDALLSLYHLSAIDQNGQITELGTAMSQFPLEPSLSKMLLTSLDYDCLEEMLTITAMMSAEEMWIRPAEKEQLSLAEYKKAGFDSSFGDHITLLFVYDSWISAGSTTKWCAEHFLHHRVLKKAQDIRTQLEMIVKKQKMSDDQEKELEDARARALGTAKPGAKKDEAEREKERERDRRRSASQSRREKERLRRRRHRNRSGSSSRSRSRSKGRRSGRDRSRDRGRDRKQKSRSRSRSNKRRGRSTTRSRSRSRSPNASSKATEDATRAAHLAKIRSEDVITRVRRVIAEAFFAYTARRVGTGKDASYRMYSDEVSVAPTGNSTGMNVKYIHPGSSLKTVLPKWLVFTEVVFTSKAFIKGLCTIEFEWVQDLLPRLKNASIKKLTGQSETSSQGPMKAGTTSGAAAAPNNTNKAAPAPIKPNKEIVVDDARRRYLQRTGKLPEAK